MSAAHASSALAAPAGRAPWSADRLLLWTCVGIPLAGLALFFLYPLATVAWHSLVEKDGSIGLGNYAEVFATRGILTATLNSLAMSCATTAVSIVLGFVIAYGLDRSCMRGKSIVQLALVLPLLAPSLVQGLGLIFLLGRNGLVHRWTGWEIDIYGFWGLLISNVFYALPQAVLILQAALRNMDARYYDAAEVMGASSARQFFDITLPNCKFGLLSAAFVVFVITITDFGNAAVIGGNYRVLATEIYSQVSGQMNFGMGSVVGILLLLPSLISVQIERVASQRQFGSASPSGLKVAPRPARGRDAAFAAGVLLASGTIIVTMATVVFASFMRLWPYRMEWTLKHYDITVSGGYAPLWTSLYLSLAAAGGGVLLLFFLSFGVCRIPRAWAKLVYMLAVLPVGVPGLVLGLSYIFAFNVPGTPLYALYGSAALIALCNFYHYHTQGFLTMMTGMRAVPQALEEAVSCLGGGTLRVLRDAVLPLIGPTVLGVFFFLFMRSMVTLSAVIFLVTPSVSVAPVSVLRLDEAGFVSQAAAYSTLIMLVVGGSLLVLRALIVWAAKRRA
ncbi:putative 2-aminoethylphosphonate ABC transporter, permease protein [compost metagenome]